MVVIWYFILWMEFRASPKKNLGPKVIVLLKLYVSIFFGNLRFYRIRCLNFHRFSLILSPNWVNGFIVVFWFHRSSKIWSPNVGLEPTTLRLRVSCSTDWASRAAQWPHPTFSLSFQKPSCYITNKNLMGSSGIWTRDLSHPKRESYP